MAGGTGAGGALTHRVGPQAGPRRQRASGAIDEAAWQTLRSYGVALASVACALGVRLLLDPLLGDKFPYATLFLAVLATAAYGGLRPTLAAIAIAALAANWFLVPPRRSFAVAGLDHQVGLGLFIATSLGIAVLGAQMHGALRRAERDASQARRAARQLDNSFDAILVSAWNGPITYWNSGAERLYGYPQHDALGRTSHDLLQTRVECGIDALLGELEATGVWKGQLRHTTRDGRERVTESRMVRVDDREGSYVVEANRDVTEQVAAQSALKAAHALVEARVRERTAELSRSLDALKASEARAVEQEQRFKLLVNGVRDYAICMLDADGRVTTWNSGAERITGYRGDDVLGRHFEMFFVPADVADGKPEYELGRAARDGRYETEAWRLRSDGSRYWAQVLLTPLHDERLRRVGYAKITRDLTEPLRQQNLLVRVAEMSPCAMLLVDPQGLIVMVNAEAERIFGYGRGEILRQPLEMLIPAPLRGRHAELRREYLQAASARSMGLGRDLHGLRKDGERFPVEIGLSPIAAANGTNTLAAVLDVTQRRHQQAELERSLAEKETLLKEVYHRVKNNLQVVQSLLTLQCQTLPEGPARTAFGDTVQRVRAMSLVHEKLYQSGNLAAVSLPDYTAELMRQIAEAHGAAGRGVTLRAEVAAVSTGLDSAVPYGLLLTELLTNCFKHAFVRQQGGAITVRLLRQPGGDLLSVSDTGTGFAAGFDLQAPSPSLGLQLAGGLARQLGGELNCRNEGGSVVSALLTRL